MPTYSSKRYNESYIFIPLYLSKSKRDFPGIEEALLNTGKWEKTKDEMRYIYRYITDKMYADCPNERLYFHLKVTEEELSKNGFGEYSDNFSIFPGENNTEIQFKIVNVHLFSFRTMVSVAAVQVTFDDCDPLYVSTGLYYLKKPNRQHLWINGADTQKTLMDVVDEMVSKSISEQFEPFFYLNSSMERSNTMSLTYHRPGADIDREAYFLKNCYKEKGFEYSVEQKKDDETLFTTDSYMWGITQENLACIIIKHTEHIEKRFIKHFGEQYLFMYVLLLHRKYDLYRILTDIGVGVQRDLSALKYYKELLYEYQTDYEFERITEVPQYHALYKKIEKKMELDALFSDVVEPIESLSQLKQEKMEEEQAKKNRQIENSLGILSLLTIFSALIDCYSYIEVLRENFINISNATPITYIHLAFSISILFAAAFVIKRIKK